MSQQRLCGCPCGQPLPRDARANRRYIDERHQQRAARTRLKAVLEARGLPTSLTMETADAIRPTRNHDANGKKPVRRRERRARVGVSVYYPTREVAEAILAIIDSHPGVLGEQEQKGRDQLVAAINRKKGRST